VSLNGKKCGMDYTFRQMEVHDRALWAQLARRTVARRIRGDPSQRTQ
jgi:hypothetical protein